MRFTPLPHPITALIFCLATQTASAALQFEAISAPQNDEERRQVRATPSVTWDGTSYPISYHTLFRSGDRVGGSTFGLITDREGKPIREKDGSPRISNYADFTSLLPRGERLFSLTHFEVYPGAFYLSELRQEGDGRLTPLATRNLDFTGLGGVWGPCAGSVTPWSSHLGSEEYAPDARAIAQAEEPDDIDKRSRAMARYFGIGADRETFSLEASARAPGFALPPPSLEAFRRAFNPYRYGYAVEVNPDAEGKATPVKHYAMGRVSMELAYVLPDRKTAYITDDGSNTGLYLFIADRAGDLTAGRLYAAQWQQTSDRDGGSANLAWIDLGHASDAEIGQQIQSGIDFPAIFDTAEGDEEAGTCPAGFSPINTTDGFECLRLKAGMEKAASRLETRRYAALRGATTEFTKMEGITHDRARGTLYLALSEIDRGMEDRQERGQPSRDYDGGGPNHIRLPYNPCGGVYELRLGHDDKIGSDHVAQAIAPLVSGRPVGKACDVDGIANPDNLTLIDGQGVLVIAEDGNSTTRNNGLWAHDIASKGLTRLLTAPYGAEVTSAYWYPDIGGHGYLMVVIQHPYSESNPDKLRDPADARAYVGYLGPFPAARK